MEDNLLEEIIADNSNPLWFELGRVMAEDFRKEMFFRSFMPLEERIKEGIREEIGKRK